MKIVSGIYHDADSVTQAVRALLGASVPAGSISVRIRYGSGTTKDVAVHDEAGVWDGVRRGARIGAVAGALFIGGLAVAIPLLSGESGLSAAPFTAALRGALGGAAAGVTLGGLIGIGRWELRDLSANALNGGSVEVRIRSGDLADTARQTLERTGARSVHTTDG